MVMPSLSDITAFAGVLQHINGAQVRVLVLEQAHSLMCRVGGAGRNPQVYPEDVPVEDAPERLLRAHQFLNRLRFDDAIVRVREELHEAEKSLARGHLDFLFSDPELPRQLLSVPFGRPEEKLNDKKAISDKVEREGLEGYLEFLTAALNQHWAPVAMLEKFRSRPGFEIDDEMMESHMSSMSLVMGLLSAIERDVWLRSRFRRCWRNFAPGQPLEVIHKTVSRGSEPPKK